MREHFPEAAQLISRSSRDEMKFHELNGIYKVYIIDF